MKINILENYSKKWELNINLDKTKIIFNKKGALINNNKISHIQRFNIVENVASYTYLRLLSSYRLKNM